MKLQISSYVLDMMIYHAEKDYPEETCGVVIGPKGKSKAIGVFPIKNIQNDLHQKDPKQYSRDAKTAYFMDPTQLRIVEKEAAKKNFEIKIIYHSHPDHGVYFSEEDKAMACPWGEPNDPNLAWLVIGVAQAKANGASLFYWDEEKKDFLEKNLKQNFRSERI
ncbi:MAG: M67 family metallopeptidase [Deltaproteobacteria bacterium]|nr:M67 family metallopeptidase [Deltaproteobacteria bacterium]